MKKYPIICLTGFATSGKDTFLKLLQINDSTPFIPSVYTRVAFADELKNSTAELIKSIHNIDIFNCTPTEKEIVRPILISVGCWVRDNIDKNYWVNKTIDKIKDLIYKGYIPIISDFRFKEEADRLIEIFGRNNIIFVEIIRTDSKYTPPQKELYQQPLIRPYIDYTINWPTVGKDDLDSLMKYVKDFEFWLNNTQ